MENKVQFFGLVGVLASIFSLAGCGSIPLPVPSPSLTPSPTYTALLTNTSTPVPGPTQTAALTRTPTLIPSPIRTSMPTVTPTRLPLVPVKVRGDCHGCAYPQLVMDAQGTLHLFWRQGSGETNVEYAQMKAGGKWVRQELSLSEAANESWHVFSGDNKLMRNPMGQACLAAFGFSYQTGELALLVRCHDGTSWRDTQKLSAGDCSPTFGTCDFAFAPDGQLRVLNAEQLSENKEVGDCSFTIDHNGGYHALWWTNEPTAGVLYRFSADNGESWSAAEKLADEYSLPGLQPDAQGHLYYWAKSAYRRWVPTKGWEAPVDVSRYVDFRRYGIEEIKRLVPAADGRLRVLGGGGTGSSGIYYFEQLSDEEWSVPVLVSQDGINADLVIDAKGVAHIAFDKWSEIYYVEVR
jgi:hypothetical protein